VTGRVLHERCGRVLSFAHGRREARDSASTLAVPSAVAFETLLDGARHVVPVERLVHGVAASDDHEAGRAVLQDDDLGAGATSDLVDDVPEPATARPAHAGEMAPSHPIQRSAAARADEGRRVERTRITKVDDAPTTCHAGTVTLVCRSRDARTCRAAEWRWQCSLRARDSHRGAASVRHDFVSFDRRSEQARVPRGSSPHERVVSRGELQRR